MMLGSNSQVIKQFIRIEKLPLILLVLGFLITYSDFTSLISGIALLVVIVRYRGIPSYGDSETVLLYFAFSLFFINYAIINYVSIYWGLFFCATPILMYMIGKYYGKKWHDEDCILLITLILTLVLALPHLIVTMKDIFVNGLVNPQRTLGVLDDEGSLAVTQRAIALSLCCFGSALITYSPKNRFQYWVKLVFIALSILALLCFFHYLSRTGIALFFAMIVVGLVMVRRIKGGVIISLVLLMGITLYFLLCGSDLYQIIELFEERQSADNSVLEAGGRNVRWMTALGDIINNPLGGITDNFFAHNLWLDVGRQAGLFPFIFLTLFSIVNLLKTIKIGLYSNETLLVKLIIVGFSLLFFLSNFTECILNGIISYLFIYMIFCGMVNSIYHHSALRKKRNYQQ